MTLTLSVLDQSIACAGRGEDHALRDTLDLAPHCEALGYHRFWVSEHHARSLRALTGEGERKHDSVQVRRLPTGTPAWT